MDSVRLLLGTTAAAAQANLGNFVGNPAFVFPIDPRPGSDGPANFYIDADFELTSISAAIDNAWEATAQSRPTSWATPRSRSTARLRVSPDTAHATWVPSSSNGTGGQAVGGAFRVVTTSLVPIGGAAFSGGATNSLSTRRPRRSP